MRLFVLSIGFCLLALIQLCLARTTASQTRGKSTTPMPKTSNSCGPKPAPLMAAESHCKKMAMNIEGKDAMAMSQNSSEMVTTMNQTEGMMHSKCYPLCLLKTLGIVDSKMMPIEGKIKAMMMTISLINDPKSSEMMGKLLDSCLSHYRTVMSKDEMHQGHSESCPSMENGHPKSMDKCSGALELISCINKGLPCPLFEELKNETM
ncbi:uncharacterized protein LOC132192858 [Neocloeon triangulifer]|uniref:uncharacterized protein LOC132192858 n=1 Tax=Neocloeon triangulifer TaxID=2078957 RepID=UPI00286F44DA|nr:uncharacterized protein LOC132192858 [Neocloeon triangulifer]